MNSISESLPRPPNKNKSESESVTPFTQHLSVRESRKQHLQFLDNTQNYKDYNDDCESFSFQCESIEQDATSRNMIQEQEISQDTLSQNNQKQNTEINSNLQQKSQQNAINNNEKNSVNLNIDNNDIELNTKNNNININNNNQNISNIKLHLVQNQNKQNDEKNKNLQNLPLFTHSNPDLNDKLQMTPKKFQNIKRNSSFFETVKRTLLISKKSPPKSACRLQSLDINQERSQNFSKESSPDTIFFPKQYKDSREIENQSDSKSILINSVYQQNNNINLLEDFNFQTNNNFESNEFLLDTLNTPFQKKRTSKFLPNRSSYSSQQQYNKSASGNIIFQKQQTLQKKLTSNQTFSLYNIEICLQNCLQRVQSYIPVFQPLSQYRIAWDVLVLLVLMLYFTVIPLLIAFNMEHKEILGSSITHFILIGILILDIFINLNTAVFKKGIISNNRKIIFHNYKNNGLSTDIIGLLTIFFDGLELQTEFYNLAQLVFFLKFYNFKRIYGRLDQRYRLKPETSNSFNLINLIIIVLYINHFFACLLIYTARIQNNMGINTWIKERGIIDEGWHIWFLHSFYYVTVVMITVGFGDISPVNKVEILIQIVTMIISCGVFAYAINELGMVLEKLRLQKEEINKNMYAISDWMNKKNVDLNLQYVVREYLWYFQKEFSSEEQSRKQTVINQLNNNLKLQLLKDANKMVLYQCPVFGKNFSEQTLQETIPLIQELFFMPEQVVFDKITENCIYFIEKGKVEILQTSKNSKYSKVIGNLGPGQFFGEVPFFTGQKIQIKVRSLEFTNILKITREDFISVISSNPADLETYHYIKDKIQYCEEFSNVLQGCLSCGSQNHCTVECTELHYYPDKVKTVLDYNKTLIQLKRQPHQRNKYKSMQFFVNAMYIQNQHQLFLHDNSILILTDSGEEQEDEEEEEEDYDDFEENQVKNQEDCDNSSLSSLSEGEEDTPNTSSQSSIRIRHNIRSSKKPSIVENTSTLNLNPIKEEFDTSIQVLDSVPVQAQTHTIQNNKGKQSERNSLSQNQNMGNKVSSQYDYDSNYSNQNQRKSFGKQLNLILETDNNLGLLGSDTSIKLQKTNNNVNNSKIPSSFRHITQESDSRLDSPSSYIEREINSSIRKQDIPNLKIQTKQKSFFKQQSMQQQQQQQNQKSLKKPNPIHRNMNLSFQPNAIKRKSRSKPGGQNNTQIIIKPINVQENLKEFKKINQIRKKNKEKSVINLQNKLSNLANSILPSSNNAFNSNLLTPLLQNRKKLDLSDLAVSTMEASQMLQNNNFMKMNMVSPSQGPKQSLLTDNLTQNNNSSINQNKKIQNLISYMMKNNQPNNQQSLQQQLQLQNLILNELDIKDFHLFDIYFDAPKHFDIYFPHNNLKSVLEKIKKRQNRKKNQSITKDLRSLKKLFQKKKLSGKESPYFRHSVAIGNPGKNSRVSIRENTGQSFLANLLKVDKNSQNNND